jgi:hypothetical protein
VTIYNIEKIREQARKDAEHYSFPLVRFGVGTEAQCIYDQEFKKSCGVFEEEENLV